MECNLIRLNPDPGAFFRGSAPVPLTPDPQPLTPLPGPGPPRPAPDDVGKWLSLVYILMRWVRRTPTKYYIEMHLDIRLEIMFVFYFFCKIRTVYNIHILNKFSKALEYLHFHVKLQVNSPKVEYLEYRIHNDFKSFSLSSDSSN